MEGYAMFTAEGDRAVAAVIEEVAAALTPDAAGRIATREAALEILSRGLDEVARSHAEVRDTAVREAALDEMDRLLAAAGYRTTAWSVR